MNVTEYLLNGTQILAQKAGSSVLWFIYDSEGNRIGLIRNGYVYYYICNQQGDVIAIAQGSNGQIVATYDYDAWGNIVRINGQNPDDVEETSLAKINPFRYRGYYFDRDTGLYYLNSRYYDPAIGRFISADSFATTDVSGVLSANTFSYCENNPIVRSDPSGELHILAGALLGGVLGGALEITAQLVNGAKVSNLDWSSIGIEIASGAIMGAAMSAGVPKSAVKTAINVATSVAHSVDNGDSLGKTLFSAGIAAVTSNAKGIIHRLQGKRSNMGFVGKIVHQTTYEPRHLRYIARNRIISQRTARGLGRTFAYHYSH